MENEFNVPLLIAYFKLENDSNEFDIYYLIERHVNTITKQTVLFYIQPYIFERNKLHWKYIWNVRAL